MSDLASYRKLSRRALIARLALWGAFAGIAAWMLVFGLHVVFDMGEPPTIVQLFWAIPRGALFAALLGWALHSIWRRSAR